MAKPATSNHSGQADKSEVQHVESTLQLPPSQSSLSVRSEYDQGSTGYITASSSRVSQLDHRASTQLPRAHPESMQSSTPVSGSPSLTKSPSSDSMTTIADHSGELTSRENLASLGSVTTFVPSTLDELDVSDHEHQALSDPDRQDAGRNDADEFMPSYDFDLREPHERTLDRQSDGEDDADDSMNNHQTLTVREDMEGDVITVSDSHATSIGNYNHASVPHSRSAAQHMSTPHHDAHQSGFPLRLSASWPSMPTLALPPSAVKLHRRRRNMVLRLLKTWQGREQFLHFTHSIVLVLYSSLDHRVAQTYRDAFLRPAGTVLAMSFPKPVRVALMQRIYTTAEGIDNLRRVILIARWVTSATEAAMEHWQHRQLNYNQHARAAESAREDLHITLTRDEPFDTKADHVEATPAVDANVAEESSADEKRGTWKERKQPVASSSPSASSVGRTFVRLWSSLWRLSHLEAAAESLATVGEACETAAVLAGGGMFWRAVGIQRLGLPFLSRRRRQGIERLGIVLSLCSVLVSLLVLRMERKALRSELRSAHRRIIRANDKLGWASDLAGTSIDRDQALSHRKRDPSRSRTTRSNSEAPLDLLGPDLQAAARDLDEQHLDTHGDDAQDSSSSDVSSSDSSSDSNASDAWTMVPDGDDMHPHPAFRALHSSHHYHPHTSANHESQPLSERASSYAHGDGAVNAVNVTSLLRSTERSLLRAESDLRNTRRRLKLSFWERIANWSEVVFLSYEAVLPHIDKEGVEGWTGAVASAIRLSALWQELSWS